MSDLEHRLTVGTRRAQSLGAADEVALGEIVSELVADRSTAADSMEWRLLLAAGTKAVLSRAGQRRPTTHVLPFELSADEAEYGEPVRQLLQQLLDPPRDDMLVSLLDQLSASPKRLPLKLTPILLAWASARPAAQSLVASILSSAGRQLAQLNPNWQWTQSAPPTASPTGTAPAMHASLDDLRLAVDEQPLPGRVSALQAARAIDPNEARQWIEVGWKKEPLDHRTALIACLETGLSLADEPFLEKCLDDRGKDVRLLAARLLSMLPESSFRQRMIARAEQCLSWQPVGTDPASSTANSPQESVSAFIRKALEIAEESRWFADPPNELPADWKRDGIIEQPPADFYSGQRVWWFSQLLSQVDPAYWVERYHASAATLVSALDPHWADAMLTGLTLAACRFGRTDWLMPIWDTIVAETGRGTLTAERRWLQNNLLTPLADHMPDEQITPRMLRDLDADHSFQTFLSRWRTMTKPITQRIADDIIYRVGEVLREAHDQHVESSTLYSADELLAFAISRLPANYSTQLPELPKRKPGVHHAHQILLNEWERFSETLRIRREIARVCQEV